MTTSTSMNRLYPVMSQQKIFKIIGSDFRGILYRNYLSNSIVSSNASSITYNANFTTIETENKIRIIDPNVSNKFSAKRICEKSSLIGKSLPFINSANCKNKYSNLGLTSSVPCRLLSSTSITCSSVIHRPTIVESENLLKSPELVNILDGASASENTHSVVDLAKDLSDEGIASTSNIDAIASVIEPSFSSLGLAHWWPSGFLQSAMEQLHINCDLPWSTTIIVTTVVLRTLIFPVIISSRKRMINMNHNLPEFQKLQYASHVAKTQQDVKLAMKRIGEFQREKGISPSAQLLPMMCSGAVFSAMFFALRGMANCPVESMASGGISWFVDLTTYDPYYLLPILTASTMALNLKLGMDASDQSTMPPAVTKFMQYGIPMMTLVAGVSFPSALNLYWLTSNMISLIQASLLRIPTVQKAVGLKDLIAWSDEDLPMKKVGMAEQLARTQSLLDLPKDSSNQSQNFDTLGLDEAWKKAELKKKERKN